MAALPRIQRAIISVSDKTNLPLLARALSSRHVEIIATGGTAKLLQEHHIPHIEVSDYTGFPEIMNGRVKTLHPKIHGGLLGRLEEDEAVMTAHHIAPIDLVVVNLYPFEKTIADPHCSLPEAIEHIDIGGPTMLRAAAKNFQRVTVVVDPNDYEKLIHEMDTHQGATTLETRHHLAQKTFAHTAHYDTVVANYLAPVSTADHFPEVLTCTFPKKQALRYGENPHQLAACYWDDPYPGSLANARVLAGKPLSYNNFMDADAALHCVQNLQTPACVIVKHATPCGAAQSHSQFTAYQQALATDPISAFGGIIAFNTPLETETAQYLLDHQFAEVIIAPDFHEAALRCFESKPNCRLLATGAGEFPPRAWEYRRISGGVLIQTVDHTALTPENLKVVTQKIPTKKEFVSLLFAWNVVRFAKSNAIVYAREGYTLGIGTGQTSRVFSAEIAALKAKQAGLSLANSVMASDAFFPFADGLRTAIQAGVTAVIQPGGSVRDKEVIEAANAAGIAMVLTGIRCFKH